MKKWIEEGVHSGNILRSKNRRCERGIIACRHSS